MKINWYIRFKNPQYVIQIILAIFAPILAYAGLTVQDLTTWKSVWDMLVNALSNPYVLILVAVSVYNATTDPSVKSWLRDSNFTMEKTEPTDPKMPLDIKGKQEVTDRSEVEVDNTKDGQ